MAEELLTTGLALGGKHVEASVMFSDIRSFTSIAESLSPADTIELLNSYYTLMFDAIGGHGGIVNQMLGDGLMADLRRPPASRGSPGSRGACGARDARAGGRVQPGAGAARSDGDPDRDRHRLGPVIAGFTGTQQRVTYTCVGDTVNLAAHLEAHTKVVGQPILIDENTRTGLGDGIRVESHGPAQFKSRSQPCRFYSVPSGQRP